MKRINKLRAKILRWMFAKDYDTVTRRYAAATAAMQEALVNGNISEFRGFQNWAYRYYTRLRKYTEVI